MDPINIGGWITIPNMTKKRSSPKDSPFSPQKNGWESSEKRWAVRSNVTKLARKRLRRNATYMPRWVEGEVASGKWHGLSTPTPGGLENPQPAGKGQQQFVLRFITANWLAPNLFQVFSQLDSYNPHHLPKKKVANPRHRGFFPRFFWCGWSKVGK